MKCFEQGLRANVARLLVCATFAVLLPHQSEAAGRYESCKKNTLKFSVLYRIRKDYLIEEYKKRGFHKTLENAESTVEDATGASRDYLRKHWPGFFEFASQSVLEAIMTSQDDQDLQATSFLKCVRLFGA